MENKTEIITSNAFIKVTMNEQGEATVNGRELHELLQVATPYHKWLPRMLAYGFEENEDFIVTDIFVPNSKGGKQTQVTHVLTFDMAKEIAMVQKTDLGKNIRRALIELEKKWNNPASLQERLNEVNALLEAQAPKVAYFDEVMDNNDLYSVTAISKDYGMGPAKFNKLLHDLGIQYKQGGRWYLTSKYDGNGYTQSNTFNVDKKIDYMQWTERGKAFLYELLEAEGIYITTVKNRMESYE